MGKQKFNIYQHVTDTILAELALQNWPCRTGGRHRAVAQALEWRWRSLDTGARHWRELSRH